MMKISLLETVGFFIGAMMATKEQKAKYQEVYEAAKRAGAQYPEVIAAQWAVESGWGTKPSGKNNLFGIKAGNGDPKNNSPGSVILTTEDIKGKRVKMLQKFRDYESIEESIADRIKFTQENPRYRKAGYFNAHSPAEAAKSLERAGYATKNGYAQLLIDVMKSAGFNPNEGQQYDYSATQPNTLAQQFAPTPTPTPIVTPAETNLAAPIASAFAQPAARENNDLVNAFEQLNGTHRAFSEPEPPKRDNSLYDKQLAEAFGIAPSTEGRIPDYIGEMIKSIYDQTA